MTPHDIRHHLLARAEIALIDLREDTERTRHGCITRSLHAPYTALEDNIREGGLLHELAQATGKRLLFYCAFGERSAMAVQAAQAVGISSARHIQGGFTAWKNVGGAVG